MDKNKQLFEKQSNGYNPFFPSVGKGNNDI